MTKRTQKYTPSYILPAPKPHPKGFVLLSGPNSNTRSNKCQVLKSTDRLPQKQGWPREHSPLTSSHQEREKKTRTTKTYKTCLGQFTWEHQPLLPPSTLIQGEKSHAYRQNSICPPTELSPSREEGMERWGRKPHSPQTACKCLPHGLPYYGTWNRSPHLSSHRDALRIAYRRSKK